MSHPSVLSSLLDHRHPGPSTPTPRAVQRERWRRWHPTGEPGTSSPVPGTENKPRTNRPPHPISFWNVDSGPRIRNTPQSPTTLSALQSDVSCWASGSDYLPGEGAAVGPACWASSGSGRLVLVFRRGPAAPDSHFLWRLSHSPRDPRMPQAVGTALAQEGRTVPPPPAGATSPETLRGPCLQNPGPLWSMGRKSGRWLTAQH